MTASEISAQFDILYSNLTNYEGSGFTAKEKSILLSYAQLQVLEKYYPIGDLTEENKRYLTPLKKEAVIPCVNSIHYSNASTAYLPVDHAYTLSEACTQLFNANSICITPGTVRTMYKVKSITEDYYGANIDNPFKQPYLNLIWRLDRHDLGDLTRILIGDNTFSIITYHLVYYTTADPIIVPYTYTANHGTIQGLNFVDYPNGLVSPVDYLHHEIIQEAVRIATASTKDQVGYQIQNLEKQLQ